MYTLKQNYIDAVYKSGALLIKEQPFLLKSGKKSYLYLNHRQFLTQINYLKLIVENYAALLKKLNIDRLAAVDSVMSPIITGALALHSHHDIISILKSNLTHGTQKSVYGVTEGNIVIIDDMTSTGSTIINAAKLLRNLGCKVNHCIVSAYRGEHLISSLHEHNLQLHAIASFKEIIDHLKPTLSSQELDLIQNEEQNTNTYL